MQARVWMMDGCGKNRGQSSLSPGSSRTYTGAGVVWGRRITVFLAGGRTRLPLSAQSQTLRFWRAQRANVGRKAVIAASAAQPSPL